MSAIIIYEKFEDAELAAREALFRMESWLRPEPVIERTQDAAVFLGWTLAFDQEAADAYARISGLIVSVCMICGRTLKEQPGGGKHGVSHGYCQRCYDAELEEVRTQNRVDKKKAREQT